MQGKKILIGLSGGIAAYKISYLIRYFVKNGAEVKIIMTPTAKQFITPLTLATLSKNPILVDFFNPENGEWNSHVDIGLWADALIIAPATANTLAKMNHGIADNLLLTTYLSAKCPVFFAPAMDLDMYKHPATQKNIAELIQRGNICIDATSGELASGLTGKGRMAEPEEIYQKVEDFFYSGSKLAGKKILITAGPTHEAIDPVRFIGNYSSGKMGYAIAEECLNNGAEVLLISGPVNILVPSGKIQTINIHSASEMYNACLENFNNFDVAIMSAAVADYTPEIAYNKKVKRTKEDMVIKLKPTKDIAADLGKIKKPKQKIIGFALETDNEMKNALLKLNKKNLDFIVLNSLQDKGAGFSYDTNKISIVDKNKNIEKFDLKSKKEVAKDIIKKLIEIL
ncbi:MAG: bifunctional phosphopantothenoylcysteine decarboxylase/phosphopantothenate--cysteine ligase CoaBC [Bacteroidales bacterium]|nr:bifunctional phosphopantothenoylcysteine decarboxylase/phosphopantothenate--cysteine ligase CoaBC [Bacteroidales bacterium]MBN2756312.1 bifunctional phosphopantothenoylcysteine decarboxylase/phosphopantothenate--cysteine ligase CoaBC [Bacteroidales bacterium]